MTTPGGAVMEDRKKERWEEIAEEISKEHSTDKLLKLTKALDQALAERNPQKDKDHTTSAA